MKFFITLGLTLALLTPTVSAAGTLKKDAKASSIFNGMELRSIGPAYMSGRISDIEIDQNDPATWYVAVSSGGVWKTINNGTTWTPLFDKQSVYSIGDVTIDPSNPNTIWVGTGENNGGRHISFGDGVYKSTDGGASWSNMGLHTSEHISDIIVHPNDSNIVWVSAQGPLWSKGGQRGLFKTTDGGQTWANVLKTDEWTGVTSLLIDPRNPDKLYAATWQRQRTLPTYVGTGPGAGIHTSDDGGQTWHELKGGLPKENMGKIGLAISPIKPDILYAAVELDQRKGGLYRSATRGESWVKMSDEVSGGTGPHYYQEIFADPHTFDRIYIASNLSKASNDGGKTWKTFNLKKKHVDDHAMAFHPTDPNFMLVGSDGGVYETHDDMGNWRFINNLPLTQFYKVAADDAKPFYNVYGGSQDNSTQGGPSRTDRANGIKNSDWFLTLFGDGHQPATMPGNPDIVYSQWQQGNLARYDRITGGITYIQPQAKPGEPAERFNWDAPIWVSRHDPKRLYHASQRMWRSDDMGDTWTAISGDLTRNENRMHMPVMGRTWSVEAGWDIYAMSNYNTIANLTESPIDENILYAGTDDGLIQVTSDGGKNWTRYEIGKIKGIPDTAYVNDIRADLFDADTVYAALDNHKYGDYKPYLIKSTNRGKTWKSIASNLPSKHLVWRIVQDHVNKDLMFIGTEFGLFFTVNGGKKWIELSGGVPTISFRDVIIQRDRNDLVVGSFGRGIYILDDYTPLRGLSEEALEQDALLFAARSALWYRPDNNHTESDGDSVYIAKNPDFGATFTYYLKDSFKTAKDKRQDSEKELEDKDKFPRYPDFEVVEAEIREVKPSVYLLIQDTDGNIVRKVAAKNAKGVNRVTWDLRYPSQKAIGDKGSYMGLDNPMAAPGAYQATLYSNVNGTIDQLAEPVTFDVEVMRSSALKGATPDEMTAYAVDISKTIRAYSAATANVTLLKDQLADFRKALNTIDTNPLAAESMWADIRTELLAIEEVMVGKKANSFIGPAPTTMDDRLFFASMGAYSLYGPTPSHIEHLGYFKADFAKISARLSTLGEVKIPALQKALASAGAIWTAGTSLPKN